MYSTLKMATLSTRSHQASNTKTSSTKHLESRLEVI